jgi:hypothetical protein
VGPVIGLVVLAALTVGVWYLAWQRLAAPAPTVPTRGAVVVVTPTAEVPQLPSAGATGARRG